MCPYFIPKDFDMSKVTETEPVNLDPKFLNSPIYYMKSLRSESGRLFLEIYTQNGSFIINEKQLKGSNLSPTDQYDSCTHWITNSNPLTFEGVPMLKPSPYANNPEDIEAKIKKSVKKPKVIKLNLDISNLQCESSYPLVYVPESIMDISRSVTDNATRDKYWISIQTDKPSRTKAIIKKGATEIFFLEYLLQSFGSSIMIDTEVTGYATYYPDFVYFSNEYKFAIDIEIDEEFERSERRPIHYIGSDDKRNEFFLEKNWFIIRFAEKQIKETPEACCNFIDLVIKKIVTPYRYSKEIKTSVPRVNRWTYEEAFLNAYKS